MKAKSSLLSKSATLRRKMSCSALFWATPHCAKKANNAVGARVWPLTQWKYSRAPLRKLPQRLEKAGTATPDCTFCWKSLLHVNRRKLIPLP